MTFPTVVANTSPLSVLPQFVEVLGKKIDKIQAELDRLVVYYFKKNMMQLQVKAPCLSFHPVCLQDRLKAIKTNASSSFLGCHCQTDK